MKLSEIETLADAASGLSSWQCNIPADTVKAMCQLIRQQHEALLVHTALTRPIDTTTKAIRAYEGFNK